MLSESTVLLSSGELHATKVTSLPLRSTQIHENCINMNLQLKHSTQATMKVNLNQTNREMLPYQKHISYISAKVCLFLIII